MADTQQPYVTHAELYSVASSLCVLALTVLVAAPRDDWFNTFAFVFVVVMQVVFAWQGSRRWRAKRPA